MRAPPKIVTPGCLMCDCASRSSASPRASRTSSVRAMVAKARLDGLIVGQRSRTVTDRPARARSPAAVSPVGPAPTTSTSTTVRGHRATASGSGYQRRMSSGVATAARLKTKRQPGWVMCAALTIDSNSSVLLGDQSHAGADEHRVVVVGFQPLTGFVGARCAEVDEAVVDVIAGGAQRCHVVVVGGAQLFLRKAREIGRSRVRSSRSRRGRVRSGWL